MVMWSAHLFRNETTDMVSHRPTLQKTRILSDFYGVRSVHKIIMFTIVQFVCSLFFLFFFNHAFSILIQMSNQYSVCWLPDTLLRSSRSFICYCVPGNLWHLPATQDRVISHYPATWWRYKRPRCLSHKQDLHVTRQTNALSTCTRWDWAIR